MSFLFCQNLRTQTSKRVPEANFKISYIRLFFFFLLTFSYLCYLCFLQWNLVFLNNGVLLVILFIVHDLTGYFSNQFYCYQIIYTVRLEKVFSFTVHSLWLQIFSSSIFFNLIWCFDNSFCLRTTMVDGEERSIASLCFLKFKLFFFLSYD